MDPKSQHLFREMGIGTRLKRLIATLTTDCTRLYVEAGESFRSGQFYAVYALHEMGPMTIGRLVSLSGFTQSAVSQTLKKLEAEGMVHFTATQDARERCVALTEAGEALVTRMMPYWRGVEAGVASAVADSGHDFFRALDGLENAFAAKTLYDRTKEEMMTAPAPDFTITPFDMAHAKAFHDLNMRWLEAFFEVEPVDVKALRDPNGYILDGGGEIWFAVRGSEALGCFALKNDGEGVFEFTKFAVDPGAQGLGVGKALMEHATARFKARGGTRLYLETNTKLKAARAVYDKYGWVKVDPKRTSPYSRCNLTMEWQGTA